MTNLFGESAAESDDTKYPEAFEIPEMISTSYPGHYLSKILYGINGVPGIWRRVPKKDEVPGAVRVRYKDNMIDLVPDKEANEWLKKCGFAMCAPLCDGA